MIYLFRREVKDPYMQENFERIQSHMNEDGLAKANFKFFEIVVRENSYPATLKYPHQLRYQPLDVLQTYLTPGVTLTWNYDSFDKVNLNFTVSADATIRAFIGRYGEN